MRFNLLKLKLHKHTMECTPKHDKHASALQIEKVIPVMNFPDILDIQLSSQVNLVRTFWSEGQRGVFGHCWVILVQNI